MWRKCITDNRSIIPVKLIQWDQYSTAMIKLFLTIRLAKQIWALTHVNNIWSCWQRLNGHVLAGRPQAWRPSNHNKSSSGRIRVVNTVEDIHSRLWFPFAERSTPTCAPIRLNMSLNGSRLTTRAIQPKWLWIIIYGDTSLPGCTIGHWLKSIAGWIYGAVLTDNVRLTHGRFAQL